MQAGDRIEFKTIPMPPKMEQKMAVEVRLVDFDPSTNHERWDSKPDLRTDQWDCRERVGYYTLVIDGKYLMGPYKAGPFNASLNNAGDQIVRNMKMSHFIKLVRRKVYILMMQYIKFRKKKTFQKKMIFPFQNGLYYAGPFNAGLY